MLDRIPNSLTFLFSPYEMEAADTQGSVSAQYALWDSLFPCVLLFKEH